MLGQYDHETSIISKMLAQYDHKTTIMSKQGGGIFATLRGIVGTVLFNYIRINSRLGKIFAF